MYLMNSKLNLGDIGGFLQTTFGRAGKQALQADG